MLLCCQKDIVKLITQKQGYYIITLKKNQNNLYKSVEQLFRVTAPDGMTIIYLKFCLAKILFFRNAHLASTSQTGFFANG